MVEGITIQNINSYSGIICINLLYFNKIISINKINKIAHVQCGIYGPNLEKELKKFNFTLRHFP